MTVRGVPSVITPVNFSLYFAYTRTKPDDVSTLDWKIMGRDEKERVGKGAFACFISIATASGDHYFGPSPGLDVERDDCHLQLPKITSGAGTSYPTHANILR